MSYREVPELERDSGIQGATIELAIISEPIYVDWVPDEKPIVWVGTALEDLRDFPHDARQDTGFQLEQVQFGFDPDDWRPMGSVGVGCREVWVKTEDGIFRVFYVTKFGDKVYVLHSFTKKTQQIAPRDITIGKRRYAEAKRRYEESKRGVKRP